MIQYCIFPPGIFKNVQHWESRQNSGIEYLYKAYLHTYTRIKICKVQRKILTKFGILGYGRNVQNSSGVRISI